MLIRYGYDITISCPQPTPIVTMLTPRAERRVDMRVADVVTTSPELPSSTYSDLFGNTCRRFMAPVGDLQIWGDGQLDDTGMHDPVFQDAREVPVAELPDECLLYLIGSRYCETDRLSQIAWDRFGQIAPGWGRVQAICDFVHGHIKFGYQDARSTRTALDAYQEQIGVCRDYAHLAIALCRCMNIPARYVNGHLGDIGVPILDPMDYSAWIEVFLEDRWMTFDPRNNIPRIGRIVVARGRDAADVPLIMSFGSHVLKSFRIWTYEVQE